jgi:hypothetical protein
MELEKLVVSQLEDNGFPVYYKNLTVKYNSTLFTEYDVIGTNFIIEVKSGKDFKKLQINRHLKYLPEGYKMYYYLPLKSEEEIQYLNERYKTITFINNLEIIYKNHKLYNEFNIRSRKDFKRFLSLPFHRIKKFDKLNILFEDFYFVYFYSTCIYDYYCLGEEDVVSSEKIKYLMNKGVINFVTKFNENIPYITSKNIKKFVQIISDKIDLEKIYKVDWSKNKIKKIHIGENLPLMDGITKYCMCGSKVIFNNLNFCDDCNFYDEI